MRFTLTSPAFENEGTIPEKYAQAGDNVSPPLAWADAPVNAKSFVLIVEDPDAPVGTVTHWVAFDIPGGTRALPEKVDSAALKQGENDMGHSRYDGPKPPKGHGAHRYHFRLTALDRDALSVSEGASSNDIKKAARGHVIAEATLIGAFTTH